MLPFGLSLSKADGGELAVQPRLLSSHSNATMSNQMHPYAWPL